MRRIEGIDIDLYWSDLTRETQADIISKLERVGITLSMAYTTDEEPLASFSICSVVFDK